MSISIFYFNKINLLILIVDLCDTIKMTELAVLKVLEIHKLQIRERVHCFDHFLLSIIVWNNMQCNSVHVFSLDHNF